MKAAVRIDARRAKKWKTVSTVHLKRSSKLGIRVRDRGYDGIRVRATSRYGTACRGHIVP